MKRFVPAAIAIFFCNFSAHGATNNDIKFSDGSRLVFKDPLYGKDLNTFGSGWKTATFFGGIGESRVLFPLEKFIHQRGVLFDNSQVRMSITGRYAVLNILRVGIVESGPDGKPFAYSRQYCPVIDTASGCVLSNNTGDICGGAWDSRNDEWGVPKKDLNSTQSMIAYQFPSAEKIWGEFLSAKAKSHRFPLKDAIADNLGVENMLACEPLNRENSGAYRAIANELNIEGAVDEAAVLFSAFSKLGEKNNNMDVVATVNKKKFLFDKPDLKFITKSYLVKGDNVKIVDRQGDNWVLIAYTAATGKVLTKWISAGALDSRVGQ